MLALHDDETIYGTFKEGGWVALPNGDRMSPAEPGWTGPDGLRLSTVEDADPIPPGKMATGVAVELVNGKPKQVRQLIDRVFTAGDVDAEMANRLDALATGYTTQEQQTWGTQVEEARAILAGNDPRTQLLAKRAAARGVPLADLAEIVLEKEADLAAASGAIMGARDVLVTLDPIPDPATWDGWPT